MAGRDSHGPPQPTGVGAVLARRYYFLSKVYTMQLCNVSLYYHFEQQSSTSRYKRAIGRSVSTPPLVQEAVSLVKIVQNGLVGLLLHSPLDVEVPLCAHFR